jgi:hypothetical protein
MEIIIKLFQRSISLGNDHLSAHEPLKMMGVIYALKTH